MCGIAGWIDYNQDLTGKEIIMEEMTESLIHRGPDDSGFYRNPHALLGHRRLTVVDPKGGAQPMTRRRGEESYTIVYNGELYNTEDVRRKLLARGHHFQSYSDTEVLLVSYMEWGPDCLQELNGIYAFGIWDTKEQSLFLARDRLGVKPLFYTQQQGTFLFGSELKALLAHPIIEPIVGEEGLVEIFGLGPARTPGAGVFKNIHELPPAYYLVYNREGCRTKRYWQLESKPHRDSLETTIETLRHLVVDGIERQLVSDVPVCTFLSGGLDSSAISAIAARKLKQEGKGRLGTFSVDYVDNDIYFQQSLFQPNSDSLWIKKMTQYIGSVHTNVIIDTGQLTSALADAVYANDLPGMADVDSSLYLFCRQVRNKATVALSGECADEIFGGYPWFTREEDLKSTTFPWSKALQERAGLLSPQLSSLPLEQYVQDRYQASLREVPKLPGETKEEQRMREMFYLNLTWFMGTLLNRKDRMSMANGLEVRVPFADHRIVEYAWNIPWSMKNLKGREKGILRKALKGILPRDVLERKKSPYPKTHHPAYLQAVQKWLGEIMEDPSSPILQLIDRVKVKEIVDTGGVSFGRPWFGQLMTGPQLIAYLIQINLWLEAYKVRVVV